MRFPDGKPQSRDRFAAGGPLPPPGLRGRMAEIPEWRRQVLRRLDVILTLFDLVLSAVFLSIGYFTGNPYFRGVGVGLLIAGVTSAVAVLYRRRAESAS